MIKLIKQDLESFLCLIGDRRPALSRGNLLRDRKRLALREAADYLFLARGDRSYLFPLEEVYTPDSRAYLCWTADAPPPRVPVDAFYLHVADASHGPRGSVILLDYRPLHQHHPPGYRPLPPHVHHPGGRGGKLIASQVGTD